MPVTQIGNTTGSTNSYNTHVSNIYPTAHLAASGDTIRGFTTYTRSEHTYIWCVYENTVNDMATASLVHTVSEVIYKHPNDGEYYFRTIDTNFAMTAGRYYWFGFIASGAYYMANGGATNFLAMDSYIAADYPTPPAVVGTTSSSGKALHSFYELVNTESKLVTTIGTPNTSQYSLLSLGAQYQSSGAQVRYDEFSSNLREVSVFDDGRFLIDGDLADSFEVELAASGQSFDAPVTINIKDVTLEEIV